MSREVVEPTTVDDGSPAGTRYDHPAYGSIRVSRVTGGSSTLYDSDFDHHNYIEVVVSRAHSYRGLSNDWHMSGDELVSIKMSEAQWASFVSSFGLGSGVPCTLNHVNGEYAPGLPPRDKTKLFKREMKNAMAEVNERLKKLAEELAEDTKLSVKQREKYTASLRMIKQQYTSNAPFVLEQFEEALENSVEKAKAEVHGYVNRKISEARISSLSGSNHVVMIDK